VVFWSSILLYFCSAVTYLRHTSSIQPFELIWTYIITICTFGLTITFTIFLLLRLDNVDRWRLPWTQILMPLWSIFVISFLVIAVIVNMMFEKLWLTIISIILTCTGVCATITFFCLFLLKMDTNAHISWSKVFTPLGLVDSLVLVLVIYNLILCSMEWYRTNESEELLFLSFDVPSGVDKWIFWRRNKRTLTLTLFVVPNIIFHAMLALQLEKKIELSYLLIFMPLLILETIMTLLSGCYFERTKTENRKF